MKNLFALCLLLMISFVGLSQKIENSVVNMRILEAEVIKEVNAHRKKLGLDSLHTSKSVYTEIASKHMAIIVKADSSFHPGIDVNNEVTNNKIYLERCSIMKVQPNTTYVEIIKYGEILHTEFGYVPETYQEFAIRIVKSWLNSPPHKEIMESDYNAYDFKGFIACSAKKSATNKCFILVDFVNIVAF
jgi:uncharacterized protein YkwD